MVVPIIIDTSDLLEKYSGISQTEVDAICDNIAKSLAARYAAALEVEANHSLHQTKKRYVQNISVVDTGKLEGTVILDYSKDPLVKMIEEGATPFNMKSKILNGKRAKIGKDGKKYVTIPFRIGTPGAVADSDVFSGTMPKEVYEVVKGKDADISVPGGGSRSAGLQLKELPVQFQSKKTRAAIKDSAGKEIFKAYEHKSAIYEGLMKFKDAVTGQNTYGTFRRVSENSDPDAFIHPGIEKYNLVSKALSGFNQETEVSVSLTNELKRLGLA